MDNKDYIKVRKVKTNVKGVIIEFDEYYRVDPDTNEEIFDRNIEIENDIRLYDIYKKQMNLLTSNEIKNIRKKYNMTQKEFALVLGVGEITIHRFENGSIQTDGVDSIIRLSDNPDIMLDLLIKNKDNFSKIDYNRFLERINELRKLKQHKIANFDIKDFIDLKFKCETADNITNRLITKYNNFMDGISKKYNIEDNSIKAEYITPLKLQKLLYYIQGLSLYIFGYPAFINKISAWQYGPVVEDVYKEYKGRNPIDSPKDKIKLCDGLEKIIDIVISSYGQMESGTLIDMTHDEDPWIKSINDGIIDNELIKDYFNKVYSN